VIAATCELLVEGVRVADTAAELVDAAPTALDGLQINWGRATTTDQPDASTCSWQLRDRRGSGSFLDTLAVGRRVQVLSTVTVPSAGDEMAENVTVDPGYDTLPAGSSANGIRVLTRSVPTTVKAAAAPHGNALSLDAAGYPYADLTPAPCSSTPGAWDQIPQLAAGATWRWSVDVYAPTQVTVSAQLAMLDSPLPTAGVQVQGLHVTRQGTGAWQTISGTVTAPAGGWGAGWPGLHVVVHSPTWAELPPGTPAVLDAANLISNPSLEANANGWAAVGTTVARDTTEHYTGAASLKVTLPTGPAVNYGSSFPLSGLKIGQQYTLSAWLKCDAAALACKPAVRVQGLITGNAVTVADTWTRSSVTWTETQTGRNVYAVVNAGPATAGQVVYADAVMVTEGPTLHPYFDGDTPAAGGYSYRWTGAAHASTSERLTGGGGLTWATAPGVWADYGPPVLVDNLTLRPPAVTSRRVLVWAGRISDLTATPSPDGQGVDVAAVAVDFTADLANVFVGDQPWAAEPMAARFARILALVGPAAPTGTVDPSLGGYQVSWRDVDNAAAGDLLRDLATTVDGVLWAAAHISTGPRLWVEDPQRRAAVSTVSLVGGLWTITVAGSASGSEAVITSCDLLADPVAWTQDTAEVITRVDATYLAQTLDAGVPAPTEAHVLVVDAPAEAELGVRRLGWTSQLTAAADAQAIASAILTRSRAVDWRISGLTWDTALPFVPGADAANAVANLLDGTLRLGLALVVTDLPAWSPSGGQAGVYVEGGTWTFAAGRWVLDMTVTPGAAQASPMTWAQAPAGWTWGTTDPAMSWRELAAVGPTTTGGT
jgi:hypothetical protein